MNNIYPPNVKKRTKKHQVKCVDVTFLNLENFSFLTRLHHVAEYGKREFPALLRLNPLRDRVHEPRRLRPERSVLGLEAGLEVLALRLYGEDLAAGAQVATGLKWKKSIFLWKGKHYFLHFCSTVDSHFVKFSILIFMDIFITSLAFPPLT